MVFEGQVAKNTVIHPASRGVAAHTAGLFRFVRGAIVNIGLSGPKICFLPHDLEKCVEPKRSSIATQLERFVCIGFFMDCEWP